MPYAARSFENYSHWHAKHWSVATSNQHWKEQLKPFHIASGIALMRSLLLGSFPLRMPCCCQVAASIQQPTFECSVSSRKLICGRTAALGNYENMVTPVTGPMRKPASVWPPHSTSP